MQTQPQAISTGGYGASPKRFKDLTQAFRRNGLALIPHLEHEIIFVGPRGDPDWTFGSPVSQGVPQEIGGDLLQSS